MSSPDPIEAVWSAYLVTRDALRVAASSVHQERLDVLKGTNFIDSPVAVAQERIASSRDVASDHAILSMWAVFERRLVVLLENESRRMLQPSPSAFTQGVQRKVEEAIEYWRPEEMLDLLKLFLPADLIGQAKQIKHYRDWVAHRNPKKPSPAKVTADMAYRVLAAISQQLDLYGTD